MPFTRDPLDYPINRLLLRVGMLLQTWLTYLPPLRDRSQRVLLEEFLIDYLDLEEAVSIGLIKGYSFHWYRNNTLRTIRIVPADSVRRTPGIKAIKELFLNKK